MANPLYYLVPTHTHTHTHRWQLTTDECSFSICIFEYETINLPHNLMEIDLSGKKLESLSSAVIQHLSQMKMLKRLVLERNPWECDDSFFEFIRIYKLKNYDCSIKMKNDSQDQTESTSSAIGSKFTEYF